jgi:hypothetical protein
LEIAATHNQKFQSEAPAAPFERRLCIDKRHVSAATDGFDVIRNRQNRCSKAAQTSAPLSIHER